MNTISDQLIRFRLLPELAKRQVLLFHPKLMLIEVMVFM